MNLCLRSLLLLPLVVTQTYGAIYDQVSQLPTYAYDYIIVGGASFCRTGDWRKELIRDHH